MSRLDELIEKLCPDGVEFLTLQECTQKVKNIKWKSYFGNDKKYIDLSSVDRDLHCIMETQNINSDSAPSRAQQIVQTDDILLGTTRPMLKRYCMIPEKYDNEICSTGFCVLRANTEIVLPRWIYHNIATTEFFAYVEQNQKGTSYPAISDASVKEFSLPVPPLKIQREIVRVLDSFTLLTSELTSELTARKKQYEFYRDKLLTFSKDTVICKLKDICDICLGLTATPNYADAGVKFISAQNISNDFLDLNNVKYISEIDFEKATSNAKPKKGDLLFTRVGSNLGHPVVVETDEDLCIFVSLGFLRIRNNEQAIIGYLKHWMNTDLFWSQVRKSVHGAAKVNLNTGWLKEFNIALPPIETQERIVHVLDNFDSICMDLNIGLPAEIEARQKQYEYYRDLLLTFAETGSTLLTDRQTDRYECN